MKKTILFALLSIAALSVAEAKKKAPKEAPKPVIELKSASDSVSYAAGYANTQGLIPFIQQQHKVDTAYMADFILGFKEAKNKVNDPRFTAYTAGVQIARLVEERMIAGMGNELKDSPDSLVRELFYQGFIAALEGDTTKFNMTDAGQYFKTRMEADKKAKDEKLYGENRRAGEKFLEENAKKEGVQVTASGLQYKVITEGTGPKPTATQEVSVKYEGKLVDGTVFDSSYERKDPVTKFRANQVIKGWTEALTMMPMGSKWELYIPYNLAYGEREQGKIKPYSALIFTVELIGITGVEAPKAEPETVPAAKLTPAKKATKSTKRTK